MLHISFASRDEVFECTQRDVHLLLFSVNSSLSERGSIHFEFVMSNQNCIWTESVKELSFE